jgi:peptidoglycan/xylan/chitin deacetylase (PgdA/CDA1 family)
MPGCGSSRSRRAAGRPGITLASHTWSHPNLAALAAAELEDELQRPLAWLRERFTGVLPFISYPYGLSSPAVERAAADAGYEAALRIDGGWLRDGSVNRYAIPRLNVPSGISDAGFRLRCSGVLA